MSERERPLRIFLSGMMGAGKSTVGAALARRIGARFVDLDAAIEAEAGRTVPEIFAARGERGFRAIEAMLAEGLSLAEAPLVLALGGGTVTSKRIRRLLLDRGWLITLRAPLDVLLERLEGSGGRPLLHGAELAPDRAGARAEALGALAGERAGAYAECHAAIATEGLDPEAIGRLVLERIAEAPIAIPLGEASYAVELDEGALERLPARLAACAPSGLVVVSDTNVAPLYEPRVRALAAGISGPYVRVVLPAGEEHKGLLSVAAIWDRAIEGGADRGALVLALGGGVVGDLAGFAAATLFRGVAFAQLPTTTLAIADASVGGKTGFDRHGKNLVGAFHQPRFVLADLALVRTLPPRELRAGLAEVVKAAYLAGPDELEALEVDQAALREGEPAALRRALRMAVALKARIVAEDERESGPRRLLNLGHTFGHAIEAAGGYRELLHGEAVALGMLAAFRVEARLFGAPSPWAPRIEALLAGLGLPTDLDAALGPQALAWIERDKKRRGAALSFVLPGAPGESRTEALSLTAILEAARKS